MHDLARVGVLHRRQDIEEEPNAPVDRKALLPGVREEIRALDVLERKIGAAIRGPPAVEKARNPGVFECRQELDFVAKAALRGEASPLASYRVWCLENQCGRRRAGSSIA